MKLKPIKVLFLPVLLLLLAAESVSAKWPPENVTIRCANAENRIALTFDDGPNAKQTGEILDILKQYGVRATFFVVGENAEKNPDLIRRIVEEGHEIGCHTYSHPKMEEADAEKVKKEILSTEAILAEIGGIRPTFFRPPCGYCGGDVVKTANALGYSVVLWSVDTRDWAHTPVEEIVSNVTENTHSGDIILCHDFVGKGTNTPSALRRFLPVLLDKGFSFVSVSELIS